MESREDDLEHKNTISLYDRSIDLILGLKGEKGDSGPPGPPGAVTRVSAGGGQGLGGVAGATYDILSPGPPGRTGKPLFCQRARAAARVCVYIYILRTTQQTTPNYLN